MGPGWGWDGAGMESGVGLGWGVTAGADGPRRLPRGPDGRVARSDVTVALSDCAVSSGRSRVPHGCGGGCSVTPTPGCCSPPPPPRAPPGCGPWGGERWGPGFRTGGVARPTPSKAPPGPSSVVWEQGQKGWGGQSVGWGAAEVMDCQDFCEVRAVGRGMEQGTGTSHTQPPPLGLQDRQFQPRWSVGAVPGRHGTHGWAHRNSLPLRVPSGCPTFTSPAGGCCGGPAGASGGRPGGLVPLGGPQSAGGWWPLTATSLRASLSKVNWILQMYSVH